MLEGVVHHHAVKDRVQRCEHLGVDPNASSIIKPVRNERNDASKLRNALVS